MITKEIAIEFLYDEGITDLKEKGDHIHFNSPFVSDTKYRSTLTFKNDIILYNDFKARGTIDPDLYKGTIFDFIKILKNFDSTREARQWFLTNYIKDLSFLKGKKESAQPKEKRSKLAVDFPDGTVRFDKNVHEEYFDYLIGRGITEEKIDKTKIFILESQKRILFPVYENGELIFWTGRSINKLNPLPWLKCSATENYPIWGIDDVSEEMWIFEGVFDALAIRNGICILGAQINSDQIERILNKKPSKIVVVMDNDIAGKNARLNILDKLAEKNKNVYNYIWRGIKEKDAGEIIMAGKDFDTSRIEKWDFKAKIKNGLGV